MLQFQSMICFVLSRHIFLYSAFSIELDIYFVFVNIQLIYIAIIFVLIINNEPLTTLHGPHGLHELTTQTSKTASKQGYVTLTDILFSLLIISNSLFVILTLSFVQADHRLDSISAVETGHDI